MLSSGLSRVLAAEGDFDVDALDPEIAAIIQQRRAAIPELMRKEALNGLAVAAIVNSELVWAEGFGTTDSVSGRPVTTSTQFSLQSVSKVYTATAVVRAAANGLVDLDKPITTYLPSLTVHSRFEDRPERRMTLRLLLSHRAGLTHEAPVGNNFDDRADSLPAHFASIRDTWLKSPVGQRYAYSNLGVDLAGEVLAAVYKTAFPQALAKYFLAPAGLVETTADAAQAERTSDRAIGHAEDHDRVPSRVPMVPSGGVHASILDVARFIQLHLNRGRALGEVVVEPAALQEMYAPCCGESISYGLGIEVERARFGGRQVTVLGHSGRGFGFTASVYWVPEIGFGLIMLANSMDTRLDGRFYRPLQAALLEAMLGESEPVGDGPALDERAIKPDLQWQERLSGLYVGSRDVEFALRDGELGWLFRSKFYPATFLSQRRIRIETPGITLVCEFRSDGRRDPAWADCETRLGQTMSFSESLAYNGSPDDSPGPNRKEWQALAGRYDIRQWGQVVQTVDLQVVNGYLYLDQYRVLDEYLPGLFFLSDGETLDFRKAPARYRNIVLQRRAP